VKRKAFLLLAITLMAIPLVGYGKSGVAEQGHHSAPWTYTQDYNDSGPACYYGQPVHVEYEATNTWTWVLCKNGDVRETLVQNGVARIYDMAGNLLDTRSFHVTERFFDADGDVAVRHEYGGGVVWYEASGKWYNANLEDYYYIWKIPGVYDFRARNRNGSLSWGWTSGDCEGGWPEGWPPQPPHP